jgi:hypothetical protein
LSGREEDSNCSSSTAEGDTRRHPHPSRPIREFVTLRCRLGRGRLLYEYEPRYLAKVTREVKEKTLSQWKSNVGTKNLTWLTAGLSLSPAVDVVTDSSDGKLA